MGRSPCIWKNGFSPVASPGFMDTPWTASWNERLRDSIRSVSRITLPVQAAERLVELVDSDSVTGQGEDYPV